MLKLPIEPRPTAITVICILGAILTAIEMTAILWVPDTAYYSTLFYTPYHHYVTLTVDAIFLLAFWGLWHMRLWGLILYVLNIVFISAYGFYIHNPMTGMISSSLLVMIVCLFYYKEMS